MKYFFVLPALLSAITAMAAPSVQSTVVQDTVLQETLVLLDARLNAADPVHAARLFDDVARRTNRTGTQVRQHLQTRLEQFRQLHDTDPAAWGQILDLRPDTMSRRQVQRLLQRLGELTDRVLSARHDYLLGTGIRWAANQAHVPVDETGTFVRRLIAHGVIDTATAWEPERRELMVSGWTEPFEVPLAPLLTYFETEEEAYVREAVRDVQRFIVPRVVRRLPASRGVEYAVRDRNVTPLIDPEFELRLTVLGLRFSGTNADLLPCMDVGARLSTVPGDVVVWETTLSHCTTEHGSASTTELDAFYEEISDLLYERIDGYFESR